MGMLTKPVLVLNKGWTAIRISTVKQAFRIAFADRGSFVDDKYNVYSWEDWAKLPVKEGDNYITSVNYDIRVPEVIVLYKYDKVFRKNAKLTKRNIYIRDGNRCQYTGKKLSQRDLDIDHVTPRSKGGKNSWSNLVVCSKEINRKKADRTPEQAGLKLIKQPSKPDSGRLLIDLNKKHPESWSKFIKQ